jgi:hypothetical protein
MSLLKLNDKILVAAEMGEALAGVGTHNERP